MPIYSKCKPFDTSVGAVTANPHTVPTGGGFKNKLVIVNDTADGGESIYVAFGDETTLTATNKTTVGMKLKPADKFEEEVSVSVIQVLSNSGTLSYHGWFISE